MHLVTPQLRETILALARRYDFEEGHSLQDERLSLRLFDETARLGLHDLAGPPPPGGERAALGLMPRDILSYAAILHDIGYVEGYEGHHKTAFRLIVANPIPGMTPQAQLLVAHVARYHRGSTPDPAKHEAYASLSPELRDLVSRLGSILRFADGLDRGHTNAVADLRCALEGDARLIVTLLPGTGDEVERWAGQKKARWFENVFGVSLMMVKTP
jgi:exopolyphosphatase/guanosine-5'-triphosphate,3'-diphosphate pyrophosphatase